MDRQKKPFSHPEHTGRPRKQKHSSKNAAGCEATYSINIFCWRKTNKEKLKKFNQKSSTAMLVNSLLV